MSRQPFYDHVREKLFFGTLPPFQQEPLDRLIDFGNDEKRTQRETAYVLATAYHETDRFKALEEYGQGGDRAYTAECALMGTGSKVKKSAQYHGRGYVMETWLQNYSRLSIAASIYYGREINVVVNPDLLTTDHELCAFSIWTGMISGRWTGKNLADYTTNGELDYVEARRIVNGTDKADLIAGYAREFETGLNLITEEVPEQCPLAGSSGCLWAGRSA